MNPPSPALASSASFDLDGVALYVTSPAVVASPLADGLALLDTRTSSYFTLNPSAAVLWQCAAEPVTLPRLRAALAEAFGRAEGTVETDVRGAVRNLVDAGLFDVVAPR